MGRKTGKPKPANIRDIFKWAEEAITHRREVRIWADEAAAYSERALRFHPRDRDAILLTKEARLALIECESHAGRAKDRLWAVENLAPPERREGVEAVVELVGRAVRDALDDARRAKEAVTRLRRR